MSKGEETRQMIVEKAADLFNRHGYDGCSLSDIMEATSLKKGGIYNHFENKDEIALEAFDYNFQQLIIRYRKKLDQNDSPLDKLGKMFYMFEHYFDHPVLRGGCPIANTAVYSADTHPKLRKRVVAAIEKMEMYITIKLEEGRKSGIFSSDFNCRQTSQMLLSTLEGAIILSRVRKDKNYLKTVVRELQEYVFSKIVK